MLCYINIIVYDKVKKGNNCIHGTEYFLFK